MSTICHGFIENSWRKDLCSNCFRTKEEHLALAAASKMYQQHHQNTYTQNNWRNSHVSNSSSSGSSSTVVGTTHSSNNGNSNSSSNNSVSINVRHHQNGLPPPPAQYQQQQQQQNPNMYQQPNPTYPQQQQQQQQTQQSTNNYQQQSGIPRGTGKYNNGNNNNNGQNSRSSLYSCYETPNRERINVTVNNVTRKGPTAGVRALSGNVSNNNNNHQYFNDNNSSTIKTNGSVATSSTGGVSVSVGRSSSYNHINTIGRTSASGLINQPMALHASSTTTNTGTTSNANANANYNYTGNNNNNGNGNSNSNSNNPSSNVTGLSHHRRLAMTNSIGSSSSSSSSGGNIRGGNSVIASSTGMNGTVAVVTNGSNSTHGNGTTSNIVAPIPSARITCPTNNTNGKTQHQAQIQMQVLQNQVNNVGTTASSLQQQQQQQQQSRFINNNGNNNNTNNNNTGKMVDLPDGEVQVQVTRRASISLDKPPGKGILRKIEKGKKRKMSVTFPKEVCAVIGYGGESSEDESDDDPIPDVLDAVTVAEIMIRNSHTPVEKEINRLTLKNTSFNSIKTNLLGFAPIEIGPIVGFTGGKSLECGINSKPLVSIGTFEARKEPLKIRKMGDDIILNTKNTIIPISRINNHHNNNSAKNMSQQHKTEVIKNKISNNNNNTNNVHKNNNMNNSNGVTVNVNTQKTGNSGTSGGGGGSGNIITTHPNHEKIPTKINQKLLTSEQQQLQQQHSSSKEKNHNVIVPPLASPRSNIPLTTTGTITECTPTPTDSSQQLISSHSSHSTDQSLSNLIILNDGNIASKRISFLKDILKEDTNLSGNGRNENEQELLYLHHQQPLDSLEPTIICQEQQQQQQQQQSSPPIILKSEVNLEIEATPIDENIFIRNDLFDDSLEDSGLDIKITKSTSSSSSSEKRISSTETSESDDTDKSSSSNSDSGNENDFSERESLNHLHCPPKIKGRTPNSSSSNSSVTPPDGNGLLRIACDLHVENLPKSTSMSMSHTAAKLSPDSVIYSSEVSSEMSTSGSNESIPNTVIQEETEEENNIPIPIPISKSSSGPIIPPILKRLAPPPPKMNAPAPPPPTSLTTTMMQQPPPLPPTPQPQRQSCLYSTEDLYDDISSVRDNTNENRHSIDSIASNNNSPDNSVGEDLYDDCSAVLQHGHSTGITGKIITTGSYDFTDTNNDQNISQGIDGEIERVPIRQNDGIEFIGIRKIDSETFLRQKTPPPPSSSSTLQSSSSPIKEKSSSPKVKRKVNQFFSTIGKRAGAAFNRNNNNHSQIEGSSNGKFNNEKTSPTTTSSFSPFSYYKRSMSQDEMNMTRTQEIYATLSPTVLKARGETGVLNKLSKLDLQYGNNKSFNKDNDGGDTTKDKNSTSTNKNKSKFSTSLKKFLRFGPKDGENKYDFESSTSSSTSASTTTTTNPTIINVSSQQQQQQIHPKTEFWKESSTGGKIQMPMPDPPINSDGGGWKQSLPPARPPPPPPRVHSLDLLNQVDDNISPHHHHNNSIQQQQQQQQQHGTMKPARPPPPIRSNDNTNNIPPNFISVFNGQDEIDYEQDGGGGACSSSNNNQRTRHGGHSTTYNPPNKPRRKASMSRGGDNYGDGGAYTANYLETTYNHITSLNFETLKLIASQTPARIKRSSNQLIKFNKTPLRWSQFYVTDVEPVCHGRGFCFYSAFWEDEPCILLIQESLSCGIPPLEFDCVETSVSFEDIVPTQFVTWEASDYVNTGNGVKVFVSVLPSCTVQKLPGYLSNANVTPSRKYFALLQAMDFWGTEEISDLLVFHQIPCPSNTYDSGALSSKSKIQIPNFGLVYVASSRHKSGSFISQHSSRVNFEMSLKQLLFGTIPHQQGQGQGQQLQHHHHQQHHHQNYHLLCDNDRHILVRRICGSSEEVEAQLRLFVQLKLFGPQAGDLDKILRYRSDKQVTQWMDKERAFCMKDAIERTLQRNSEPISPLRKSFVEFLMISDNCAKAVLDLVVDLNPDL